MSALASSTVRPVAEWLAPPSDPSAVLRAAAEINDVIALIGDWGGGGAIITGQPLVVSTDPIAALADQPHLAAGTPDGFVGGGWFGWIAYDGPSRVAFHDHVLRLRPDGWYFEALVSTDREDALRAVCDEFAELVDNGPRTSTGWRAGPFTGCDQAEHLTAVERGIEAIRAGDIYQVNVCTRLGCTFTGSAAELFAAAVRALEPNHAAYLAGGGTTIVSLSPELFLRRRGRSVVSAPIKGTAEHTEAGRERLSGSTKDAAENVMIVDLVRNDLGSIAVTGSVTVPELLALQPHTGVWQLVSTVSATLPDGVGDDALMRAAFPPGSVTGAPKSSAVRVVREVEATGRGAYTGAIGFASPVWGSEFSVAIRTFEIADGRVELGVGGGVTADSVPMLEWRECLHKARPLLEAIGAELAVGDVSAPPEPQLLAGGVLETLLAVDGVVLRLADHLARLDRSCRELYGAPAPDLADELREAAAGQAGRLVLRAVVVPVGAALRATVTRGSAGAAPQASDLRTVPREGGLWRHKWADRSAYAADEAALGRAAPLYVAADGAVLETSRGNVVLVESDGTLVTAPLRDDLLPGVTRRAVLDLARDTGRRHEIRTFTLDDLTTRAAFWTSSVSLAVPIRSVDGITLPRADAMVEELRAQLMRGGSVVR